ncbi:MAG: hypothetical protein ACO1QS_15410 [Verrucomicrobiota bacterium]
MRTKIALIFSFALLVLLCGCLQFEEQSMSYRYDEKTDTLYIFQEYRGISAGQGEGLSEDEIRQLESVIKTERTFFFANWITEFDREALREHRNELKNPPADKKSELSEEERKLVLELLDLALANVKVENGPFYFDAEKRLCGVQKVTVKKVSELIRNANKVIPIVIKDSAKDEEDAADKAVLVKMLEKRREFIWLEKNTLNWVWPMTKADHEKNFGAGGEAQLAVEAFKRSGGSIEFKEDEVHFRIGTLTDRITTLAMPVAKAEKDYKGYKPNAVEEVKKRAVILEKFDVEAARKEFLK